MSLVPGIPQQLAGGVRRLVAPNPGMMTGPGTNTYLLGDKAIAVIDPGPRIQSHLEAIRRVAGAAIRWILVTHTHPDHSPAARELAVETGAQLLGQPAPEGRHQDGTFKPGRVLQDGDVLQTDEFHLTALHTPGHASNHLCFLHGEHGLLFTGDHIINGSTVVIDPPDGNMRHYIDSLRRLLTVDLVSIAPGHGDLLTEPYEVIEWIIDHRLQREARVIKALEEHSGLALAALVPHAYADVDPDRYVWAARSLLAHLQKLAEEGRATVSDGRWQLL